MDYLGSSSTTAAVIPKSYADARFLVAPTWAYSGSLSTVTGSFVWYNDTGRTLTFVAARASVGVAPTGASVIVDINKNGTTIFTTQTNRPTIAVSTTTATSGSPDVTTVSNGEYLSVDIDQVGSTVAGSNLTVTITLK